MDNKKEVSKYSRFRNNPVWKEMIEILQKRVVGLDVTINTVGKNDIKFSERDIAILTKQAILAIMNYPEQEIKNLMENISSPTNPINDNPYEKLVVEEEDEDEE